MQSDDQTLPHDTAHPAAADRAQGTTSLWRKNPWLILVFASVLLLGLWVGIGIWTEQRRRAAIEELTDRYGVYLDGDGAPRFPVWLPNWLGQMLPPDWAHDELMVSAVIYHGDDDRIARLLRHVGELEAVRFIESCTFSDEALLELIEAHQLKHLTFNMPQSLTPRHLAALRQRGGVQGPFSLHGPFNEQHLQELSQMAGLEILYLNGPISANVALSATGWPALGFLKWDDSQLTDTQFAMLGTAPKLTALHLEKTRLTSRSGPLLERMAVDSLHLESPDVDDALMENLGRIQSLSHLHLPHAKITDAGLKAVAQLPELWSLRVTAHDLTVSCARKLRECAKLRFVVLDTDASVTDDWVAELVHERLEGIELINSAVTDEGVATIQKVCPNTKRLSLAGSRITDRCLPTLSLMLELGHLDLSNTAITDAGLEQFQLQSRGNPVFTSQMLDLSGTRVTREGALAFLQRNGNPALGVRLGPKEVVRLPPKERMPPPFQ